MGLSASQARLLSITSRKADCEFMSMMLSHQKIGLSRDMENVSDDYQNALSQTKLVYDYYGANNQQSDLSYNLLMSPSVYNDYSPKLITNLKGNVVLNGAFAAAARAAGIPTEGFMGTPSSDVRNKFVTALTNNGVITNATALSIQNVKYNNMAGLGETDLAFNSTMDITYDQLLENIKANCYSTEESGLRLGGFYALQDNEFADWYLLSGRGKCGVTDGDTEKYDDLDEAELKKSYTQGYFNDQSDMYGGTGLYVTDNNGNELANYTDRWNLEDGWDVSGHTPLSNEKHSYDLSLEELLTGEKQFNFSIATAGQLTSDIAYMQQLIVGNEDPDNCSFLNWMTDQFKIVLGGSDQNNMALQYAYNAVYDLIYPNEDAQEVAGTKDMRQDTFGEYLEYLEAPVINYLPTASNGSNDGTSAGNYYTAQFKAQDYLGMTKSGMVVKGWDCVDNKWVSPSEGNSTLTDVWGVYFEASKVKQDGKILGAPYKNAKGETGYTNSFEEWIACTDDFKMSYEEACGRLSDNGRLDLLKKLQDNGGLPYIDAKNKKVCYTNKKVEVVCDLGENYTFNLMFVNEVKVGNPFHFATYRYKEGENGAQGWWDGNRQQREQAGSIKLSLNLNNLAKLFLTAYTEYMGGIEDSNYLYNKNKMEYLNLYDPKSDDIFTIPGEVTVDGDDNLQASFYDTIFNLICTNGWSENGQIEDKEYMQNMLKNGLMLLSSIGSDKTYYQQSYANDVYVVEVTDTDAVAQAEAKYNSEKNKIEAKENKIDLKMKNLDTELSSLSTEYDTVKSLISKTIEKSIKRYDA